MRSLLLILLLLSITRGVNAQAIPSSKATYLSWIYLNNNPKILKGIIVATNDSSIQFIDRSFLTSGKVVASYQLQTIPVSTIESIKLRKRNSLTKGTLLGAAGGAAAGALIGYATGDDNCQPTGGWLDCIFVYSAEEKAGLGAILGIMPGMGIGMLLGSSRETIHINGNKSVYDLARDELKKYTLTEK